MTTDEQHQKIALIAGQGAKNIDIAKAVCVHYNPSTRLWKRPIWRAYPLAGGDAAAKNDTIRGIKHIVNIINNMRNYGGH
jgi:hypothetical protein